LADYTGIVLISSGISCYWNSVWRPVITA